MAWEEMELNQRHSFKRQKGLVAFSEGATSSNFAELVAEEEVTAVSEGADESLSLLPDARP